MFILSKVSLAWKLRYGSDIIEVLDLISMLTHEEFALIVRPILCMYKKIYFIF